MSIITRDDIIAATRQRIPMTKTATRTTIAAAWFSVFDLAGSPGAGVLAGGKTTPASLTTGEVPTDAIPGYPTINAFGGGAQGYITKLDFGSSVACRLMLCDCQWIAGAFAFNANQAITSPSWSSRATFDGGVDYKGSELWVEQVTLATLNQAVAVSYLDEGGAAGTTAATGIGSAPTVGRMWQLPLASGDSGVSGITNVTGTVGSAGTFNVRVLRPLIECRVPIVNGGDVLDYLKLGLPEIFADSALFLMVAADSTSSGVPDMSLVLSNK